MCGAQIPVDIYCASLVPEPGHPFPDFSRDRLFTFSMEMTQTAAQAVTWADVSSCGSRDGGGGNCGVAIVVAVMLVDVMEVARSGMIVGSDSGDYGNNNCGNDSSSDNSGDDNGDNSSDRGRAGSGDNVMVAIWWRI